MASNYQSFKSNFALYDHLLEIDYNDGNGWIDESDKLEMFSIIQSSDDFIAGLTYRTLELEIFVETPDLKYYAKNLKVRLFLKVSSDNGVTFHTEKLFEGFSLGEITQPTSDVVIVCKQAEERLLTKSNAQAIDGFDFGVPGVYDTDGELFDKFFESDVNFGASTLINEEFPASGTWNYRPSIATGSSKNNMVFGGDRQEQINQFLLSLGVLGGFDKDGVFRIKKRVWNSPTVAEVLDGDLIYENSYTTVSLSNKLVFNSIKVSGFSFNHYYNPSTNFYIIKEPEDTINLNITLNQYQKTLDITTDFLASKNATRSKFIELEDFVLGNYNDSYFENVEVSLDKEGSNIVNSGVELNSSEYTSSHIFSSGVYGIVSNDTTLNLNPSTNPFTIEAWVYPITLNPTFGSTICARRTGDTSGFHFFLSPRGEIGFDAVGASAPNRLFISTNSKPVVAGKYSHVAVASTAGSQDELTLYVDGLRVASYAVNPLGWTDSSSNLFIGYHPFPGMQFFGHIQDLKISNYAKSQEELRFNADLIQPLPEPNLIGFWKINEGSGSTVTDYSNNTNTMSIFGTPSWSSNVAPITADDDPTILTDFVSGQFVQTAKINAINETNNDLYVQQYRLIPNSYYELREQFTATSSNFNSSTELKIEKKYQSYYINSEAYAQDLADNLLSIYNDITGYYQFKISYLPKLEVGDIVTFDTPELANQTGVVLEIRTTYNGKDNFGTSTLTVKKINV